MRDSYNPGRTPESIREGYAFSSPLYSGRSPISGYRNPGQNATAPGPGMTRQYELAHLQKMSYEDKEGASVKEIIAAARNIPVVGRR